MTDPEELKARIVSSVGRSRKKPESIAKGIIETIKGTVDEDTALIIFTEQQLNNFYFNTINTVIDFIDPGNVIDSESINDSEVTGKEYKIFVFIYLNSKQGPKIQTGGITIRLNTPFNSFVENVNEKISKLENRYIGGEEYNEQRLILSRVVNMKSYFQVWQRR